MAEEILGRTEDGKLLVLVSQAGPAAYSSGGITIVCANLNKIDHVININNNGGYKCDPSDATISNNSLLAPVRYMGYACPGVAASSLGYEVLNGTVMSTVTFKALVIGH